MYSSTPFLFCVSYIPIYRSTFPYMYTCVKDERDETAVDKTLIWVPYGFSEATHKNSCKGLEYRLQRVFFCAFFSSKMHVCINIDSCTYLVYACSSAAMKEVSVLFIFFFFSCKAPHAGVKREERFDTTLTLFFFFLHDFLSEAEQCYYFQYYYCFNRVVLIIFHYWSLFAFSLLFLGMSTRVNSFFVSFVVLF